MDPENIDEIKDGLLKYLEKSSDEDVKTRVAFGNQFKWENNARKLLSLYEEISKI